MLTLGGKKWAPPEVMRLKNLSSEFSHKLSKLGKSFNRREKPALIAYIRTKDGIRPLASGLANPAERGCMTEAQQSSAVSSRSFQFIEKSGVHLLSGRYENAPHARDRPSKNRHFVENLQSGNGSSSGVASLKKWGLTIFLRWWLMSSEKVTI